MTAADVVVEGRGHLDDPVVLHVQFEVAADAAVGADRGGDGLLGLIPGPGLAHVVLALEHQRAGRADPDAVAAVHAGRVGQAHVELSGDAGVESPPGDPDGEGVLGVLAARLHALVAQDAARAITDVAVVVVLHRLGDRVRLGSLGRVVLAGTGRIALPGRVMPGGSPPPAVDRAVSLHP